MLDFCIRYVTYLDRLLIDGIKWLADNDAVYYAFMCLIPVIGTAINVVKDAVHSYPNQKIGQVQDAEASYENVTKEVRKDILSFIESELNGMIENGKPENTDDLLKCEKHLKTLYEHEKLMNHNELMHKIKEEEKPRPIVQYSNILSANEIRSKFKNGQRSKSSHRGELWR